MFTTLDAALNLGIKTGSIVGQEPTNESEFLKCFRVLDENCEWVTDSSKWGVTWAQIEAEKNRLQAEYDAKQYQRDRAAEYPSFADQFDTLYHGGYDAWKAQIDAIKAKYPKP